MTEQYLREKLSNFYKYLSQYSEKTKIYLEQVKDESWPQIFLKVEKLLTLCPVDADGAKRIFLELDVNATEEMLHRTSLYIQMFRTLFTMRN